jgi:hypothetical protein
MSYVITIIEEKLFKESSAVFEKREIYRQELADIYGPEGIKKIIRRINADETGAAKPYIPQTLFGKTELAPKVPCSVCGVTDSRCVC